MATWGTVAEHDRPTPLSLTEEDIPGASLTEPFEGHSTTELRWWLLYRWISVPTSWKKAQAVNRYKVIV